MSQNTFESTTGIINPEPPNYEPIQTEPSDLSSYCFNIIQNEPEPHAESNILEMNIKDCDVFEKVCDFELNKRISKTLWNIKLTSMDKVKLNDKSGRVYLIVVDDIIKKIGQTDDNFGIKKVGNYGVGNGGSPSDRTTGVHYYIGKQLLNGHNVSFYCVWCPKAKILSPGFSKNDELTEVIGSFSAKDLEKYYVDLYVKKIGIKPELNLQEDNKSWDVSIQDINKVLKSKNIPPLSEIHICDDYWKLYHWKYNNYNLFPHKIWNK